MPAKLSSDQNEFTNAAGAVFRAIPGDDCGSKLVCALFDFGAGCLIAPCHAETRKDGRNVIWQEVTA